MRVQLFVNLMSTVLPAHFILLLREQVFGDKDYGKSNQS